MQLVITTYLDRNADDFESRLDQVVPVALDAAAERVSTRAQAAMTTRSSHTMVVRGGLDLLEGTEVAWEGIEGLTAVRFVVPWDDSDHISADRLLAANRFAQTFSSAMRAAA